MTQKDKIPEALLYICSRTCRRKATSINPVVTTQSTVALRLSQVDGFRNMTLCRLVSLSGRLECFTSTLNLPLG